MSKSHPVDLIERTVAMISVAILLVALSVISTVCGQRNTNIRDYGVNPSYEERPKPYSFSYSAPSDNGVGQSSRSETADGSGNVLGSYSLNNDEGHYRIVEYSADKNGFRASIRTNEPGTESKNPADVFIDSEAAVGPYAYTPVVRRPVQDAPVKPLVVLPPVLEPAYRRPTYRRPGPISYQS